MIRLAIILLVLSTSMLHGATLVFQQSATEWVRVSDDTGRIHITDDAGTEVKLPDSFGTVSGNTRTIRAHGGGYVHKVLFMMWRDPNQRVRMLCDGFDLMSLMQGCTSSSTLWLGMKNVCIGRNAVFNFHGASADIFGIIPALEATRDMANAYPPNIRHEFVTKWSKRRGINVKRITAKQLLKIQPDLEYCE